MAAGTALVVLPGVWHRYAPDPKTGWTEKWIELQGPTPEALFKNGVLSPARAVVTMERARELAALMDGIEGRLRVLTAGFDPEAAALALHALSLVVEAPRLREPPRPITSFVAQAEQLLMDSVDDPPRFRGSRVSSAWPTPISGGNSSGTPAWRPISTCEGFASRRPAG